MATYRAVRLILMFCLSSTLSFPALTADVAVAGHVLAIDMPPGYCQLGSSPPERRIVDFARANFEANGAHELLVYFAACDQLVGLRTGKAKSISRFGQFLALKKDGKVIDAQGQHSRKAVIELFANYPKFLYDMTALRAARKFKTEGYEFVANHGIISSDETAAYMGTSAKASMEDGSMGYQLGVSGISLVRDLVIQVNLYERAAVAPDMHKLLAAQRINMSRLVAGNR